MLFCGRLLLQEWSSRKTEYLVCGFCWMRLLRKAGIEVDRVLKVNKAILKVNSQYYNDKMITKRLMVI